MHDTTCANTIGDILSSYTIAADAYSKISVCSSTDSLSSKVDALELKFTEKDVDEATKTLLHGDGKNIYITPCENGYKKSARKLIPDIKDIIVHNNHVVIVEFVDDTKEKAVLHPDDNFSTEQGIMICITKKLLGGTTSDGANIYNKLTEYALNVLKNKEQKKVKDAAAKAERKAAQEKRAQRKAAKKAAKRDEQIQILKEAYISAMTEMRNNNAN